MMNGKWDFRLPDYLALVVIVLVLISGVIQICRWIVDLVT